MAYESLSKLLYKDTTPDRFARNEALARERLNAESTFRTGVFSDAGEFFLAMPRELQVQMAHILQNERHIASLVSGYVGMERGALIRSLVIDEVVSTNDIEGVYSTRRQIGDLLEAKEGTGLMSERRFRELTCLYLSLDTAAPQPPTTLADIRAIYDQVMDSEPLSPEDRPDGRLFRKDEVSIHRPDGKTVHTGLFPERAIAQALERALAITTADEIPPLVAALMAHFIFEYAHPFYDGNGRTSRYLLALWLRSSLTIYTVLSLSRIIAENRGRYYRAFTDAEKPQNHGELTLFVMHLLDEIALAQTQIVESHNERRAILDRGFSAIPQIQEVYGLSLEEANVLMLVFQYELFTQLGETPLDAIVAYADASKQTVRKRTLRLTEAGLLETTSQRPLRFRLTNEACKILGLMHPSELHRR